MKFTLPGMWFTYNVAFVCAMQSQVTRSGDASCVRRSLKSTCGAPWSAYVTSYLLARSSLLQNLSTLNSHSSGHSYCRHGYRAYGVSKYEARPLSAVRPSTRLLTVCVCTETRRLSMQLRTKCVTDEFAKFNKDSGVMDVKGDG